MNHFCCLCFVFVILSRLFIAACVTCCERAWLFVMCNCVFVTFPCGILDQVWYLLY